MSMHSISNSSLAGGGTATGHGGEQKHAEPHHGPVYPVGCIPTRRQLAEEKGRFEYMLEYVIPARYAGRSGRMKQCDTARMQIIRTRILPDILCGKLPSDEDVMAIVTLGDKEISALPKKDQALMKKWTNDNCPDIRRRKKDEKVLGVSRQMTLLEYGYRAGMRFGGPVATKRGRPPMWRDSLI